MHIRTKDRKDAPGSFMPGHYPNLDQAPPASEKSKLDRLMAFFTVGSKSPEENRENHIKAAADFVNARPLEQQPTVPSGGGPLGQSKGSVPSLPLSKGPMGKFSVSFDDAGSNYGVSPLDSFDGRNQNVSPSSTMPIRSQGEREHWKNNGSLPTSAGDRDEAQLYAGGMDQLRFARREDAMPYAEVDGVSSVSPGSRPYGNGVEVSRRDTYPSNPPVELAGHPRTVNHAPRQESTTWQAPSTHRGPLSSHPAGIPTDVGQQHRENGISYPATSRGTETIPYRPPSHGEPRTSSSAPQPNVNGQRTWSRVDTREAREPSQQSHNDSYMAGGSSTQLGQYRSEPNAMGGSAHPRGQYDRETSHMTPSQAANEPRRQEISETSETRRFTLQRREAGAEPRQHPGPYGSSLYPELAQVCDIITKEVQSKWRTLEQYSNRLEESKAALERKVSERDAENSQLNGRIQKLNHGVDMIQREQADERERHAQALAKEKEAFRAERLRHEQQMHELMGTHDNEIEHYKKKLQLAEDRRIAEIQDEIQKRHEAVEKCTEEWQQKLNDETARTNRLRNRMATFSTNDYVAITDPEFKEAMGSVSSALINLCNRVARADGLVVSETLDPRGYWARQSSTRNWPKFVRHICWTILLKGFFTLPLGYGVFSRDTTGHEMLMWDYRRFIGNADPEDPSIVLPTDSEANHSRAWNFKTIRHRILASEIETGRAHQYPEVSIFKRCVSMVADEIRKTLWTLSSSSSGYSSTMLVDKMGDEIPEHEVLSLVTQAGKLALMAGSQRAHVLVEGCEHGADARSLRGRFQREGAEGKDNNSSVAVDIMLQPCLRRVGDGHEDTSSGHVVVIGSYLARS